MAAYYFYRATSRINDVIFTIIAIATFIPYEVTAVPLIKLLISIHIFDSIPGLVFSFLVFFLPTGALLDVYISGGASSECHRISQNRWS
jgi:ABC-type sugar transport system, permease component